MLDLESVGVAHSMANYKASILVVDMGRKATKICNFENLAQLGPVDTTKSSIFSSLLECTHLIHLIDDSTVVGCSMR